MPMMTRMAEAIRPQAMNKAASMADSAWAHRAPRAPTRRRLPALHDTVDDEGEHRRQQQDQADHRAHLEVLLADDLLVDVGGEHIVLAADHLRHAEIGDDQDEDHEGRADQAVAGTGQGDRPENAPGAGLQRSRRLVVPRIGDGERRRHDDQRVRKGPEHLADHDADRPIDRVRRAAATWRCPVAEQIDEADGRQQRRRQQRNLRRSAEEAAARHAGARQAIGDRGRREHADHRADDRDRRGCWRSRPPAPGWRNTGEIGEPDELAGLVLEGS